MAKNLFRRLKKPIFAPKGGALVTTVLDDDIFLSAKWLFWPFFGRPVTRPVNLFWPKTKLSPNGDNSGVQPSIWPLRRNKRVSAVYKSVFDGRISIKI
jgi:hypothetical protein